MMAIRRYTREQLLHLRNSPLVQRPDNLQAIEQWIEYVYVDHGDGREKLRIPHSEAQQAQQQSDSRANARRQPQSKVGGDASPMGSFSAGIRPGLVSRTTGSKNGEDMSLGPPRTTFPSSRNTARLADFGDKSNVADAGHGEEQETSRSKFFSERANRKSANDKDSWTTVRERRALEGDDESRHDGRHNRRDRDHDGDRRNGHGEKFEGRWTDRKQNGDRPGGWRERQRERERDNDRSAPVEKEPEWMGDAALPDVDDDLRTMGMPRNQEDFQKWKDAMSGKKAQPEEPEPPAIEPAKEMTMSKQHVPLVLEGVTDKPFGAWGDGKPASSDSTATLAKVAAAKGRPSRFASMFKEAQPKEEEQSPPAIPPVQLAASNGTADDAAGFKRILQMLGGTTINQSTGPEVPTSPTGRTASKQKSRFTGFFDQTPKSPEMPQSPPENVMRPNAREAYPDDRGFVDDTGNMFGGPLQEPHRNPALGSIASPEPPMNGNRDQQGPPGRPNDIFLDQHQQQPPSRGAATPDVNIQNLLASQRAQKSQAQDKNSQFLLNLLQEKGSRPPSQQQQPHQQQRPENFPLWLGEPPSMSSEPHAPKPRGAPPPPGFIDDQLLRNAPRDAPRQDQQPMPERRTSQRAPPPGFIDEQSLYLQQQQQQQRRNFPEPPPPPPQHQQPGPGRRMSGHPSNPQQMQLPPLQHYPGGAPPPLPDFPQSPPGGNGQGPPPGFNPQMQRHPPGFHNFPNAFPPGARQGRSDMPGGSFPGGMPPPPPQNMASPPPNAPPGFFGGPQGMPVPPGPPPPPPPGFMGMRGPPGDMIQNGGMGMRDGGRGFDDRRFDAAGPPRR